MVATLAGLVLLWPPPPVQDRSGGLGPPVDLFNASVTSAVVVPCNGGLPGRQLVCRDVTAHLDAGPEKGSTTTLNVTEGPDQPTFREGDRVVLGRADDGRSVAYYFADYQRKVPLLLLGVLFAGAVIGLARWRGVAALIGLVVSLLVLVRFVLPAILAGSNPLAVSLVGSSLIAILIIYLAHGVNTRTTAAVLGTLFALAVTALLAVVFVGATRLTGLASEEGTYLRGVLGTQVNLQGLLLGGVVIGALGVLNDVTVTQAAAVWEIHAANPAVGARPLYRSAMRIGRDHIASTVDTLVLAYAGAALPLFVVFTIAGRRLSELLTGEIVAEEVVKTLVGSIGLVASVPITTALACLLVTRLTPTSSSEPVREDRWSPGARARTGLVGRAGSRRSRRAESGSGDAPPTAG